MVMRLDVEFPRPLGKSDKVKVLLATAGLAKCQRVRFISGDYAAVILAEALSARCLSDALLEQGLVGAQVHSSLDEQDDLRVDDPPGEERLRAIGR
jgi:hypothetical protein